MKILAASCFIVISSCLAQADDAPAPLPPGLDGASLLPGWVTPDGHRMTALLVELAPGWKTYWRSPGDAGVPPSFDWSGSDNLDRIEIHWPRPEIIQSGGMRTLGYHDRLVLPIEAVPVDAAKPISLQAKVDFGICESICVPAHVELKAPQPEADDPVIRDVLADLPRDGGAIEGCQMKDIDDGIRVAATVPVMAGEADSGAALELDGGQVWVSDPFIAVKDGVLTATADFVDGTGKPFPLNAGDVRLTLIDGDEAVEFHGCPS